MSTADAIALKKALQLNKAKSPGTFHLFERRDYYVVYEDDAWKVGRDVLQSQASIKHTPHPKGSGQVSYMNVNKGQFVRVVRDLLLIHQYRIEVYQWSNATWNMSAKGSPGNLADFEDVFDSSSDIRSTGNVLAVKLSSQGTSKAKKVAAAACDVDSSVLTVCEFADGHSFSNLKALLLNLSPKECLVPADSQDEDYETLVKTITNAGILCSKIKQSGFKSPDVAQDVSKLLKTDKTNEANSTSPPELNAPQVMSCVSALIHYLSLLKREECVGGFSVQTYQSNQHMRLDPSAARALELFSTSFGYNQEGSLFKHLNRCKTVPGQKLLDEWIRQPLTDSRRIEERLSIVEKLVGDSWIRERVRNQVLNNVPNTYKLTKRIASKKASLQDCVRVYQVVQLIAPLLDILSGLEEEAPCPALRQLILHPFEEIKEHFEKYTCMIEETVDFEHEKKENELRIRPDFDSNLEELNEQLREVKSKMESELRLAASKLRLDPARVKLENTAQSGWVFRVTRKDEKNLRGSKEYDILETQKAHVAFTNRRQSALREDRNALTSEYQSVQNDLVSNIVAVACNI